MVVVVGPESREHVGWGSGMCWGMEGLIIAAHLELGTQKYHLLG
jgi:hypothetical protein